VNASRRALLGFALGLPMALKAATQVFRERKPRFVLEEVGWSSKGSGYYGPVCTLTDEAGNVHGPFGLVDFHLEFVPGQPVLANIDPQRVYTCDGVVEQHFDPNAGNPLLKELPFKACDDAELRYEPKTALPEIKYT
jgi:hypothetical protein